MKTFWKYIRRIFWVSLFLFGAAMIFHPRADSDYNDDSMHDEDLSVLHGMLFVPNYVICQLDNTHQYKAAEGDIYYDIGWWLGLSAFIILITIIFVKYFSNKRNTNSEENSS